MKFFRWKCLTFGIQRLTRSRHFRKSTASIRTRVTAVLRRTMCHVTVACLWRARTVPTVWAVSTGSGRARTCPCASHEARAARVSGKGSNERCRAPDPATVSARKDSRSGAWLEQWAQPASSSQTKSLKVSTMSQPRVFYHIFYKQDSVKTREKTLQDWGH